jgi:hypothetical protein
MRKAVPFAFLLLAAVGCSHTYRFQHVAATKPVQVPKLTGKSLALDLTGVPPTYEADASGHHFTIVDLRAQTEDMARRLFANERVVNDAATADVVLKLVLTLQMGSTFTGASCTAAARWELAAKDRKVSADATSSSAIGAIANGGRNCEIATVNAVAAALDASVEKL